MSDHTSDCPPLCPEIWTCIFRNLNSGPDDRLHLSLASHMHHSAGIDAIPNYTYISQSPSSTSIRQEGKYSKLPSKHVTIHLDSGNGDAFPVPNTKVLERVQGLISGCEATSFLVGYTGFGEGKLDKFIDCHLRELLTAQTKPTTFIFPRGSFYSIHPPAGPANSTFAGLARGVDDTACSDLREITLGTIIDPDTGLSTGTHCTLICPNDTSIEQQTAMLKDLCAWSSWAADMRQGGSRAEPLEDVKREIEAAVEFMAYDDFTESGEGQAVTAAGREIQGLGSR